MSWSLKLLTVRGIPVRVHASFLLVVLWAAYVGFTERGALAGAAGVGWLHGAAFMVIFVVLLFGCVVLHELGHSMVAQLFGVQVQDITLWPIGGMARMSKLPERPYQEFLISAAGPAVNVMLALALGALALAWIGPNALLRTLLTPRLLTRAMAVMDGQSLLLLLTFNNASLVLFNLIPAFPMDGGRLLRSFLAVFMPFAQATRVASMLGQSLAVVMIVAGLVSPGAYLLVLIGLFVFLSAWQERQQTLTYASLTGVRVRQATQPIGPQLYALETAGEAIRRVGIAPQMAYLVTDGGRLVGMLSRRDLLGAVRRGGPGARISQYMRRDVVQFGPDDPLTLAAERLAQRQASAGVVVENGQVIGAISRLDIARLAEVLEAFPAAATRE